MIFWELALVPNFLQLATFDGTFVKLSSELGKITFSTGKPKLTPGEVSTFQEFLYT